MNGSRENKNNVSKTHYMTVDKHYKWVLLSGLFRIILWQPITTNYNEQTTEPYIEMHNNDEERKERIVCIYIVNLTFEHGK